jgi:hypothetical protein
MGITKMTSLQKLVSSPYFWLGFFLKILIVLSFESYAINQWYGPFLYETSQNLKFDPWKVWVDGGGGLEAFPYGYVMWIAFLPAIFLANLLGFEVLIAYFITIFIADLLLCLVLINLLTNKATLVLKIYWLSPIILVSYALGLNDLIPALFLVLALFFIKNNRFAFSAAALVCAISAKISMLVALPFFIIYIFNNKSHRHHLPGFLLIFLILTFLLGIPFLVSEDAVLMLFGNPEMSKVFYLSIELGQNIEAYIVPLLYLMLLYLGWRVRPLNFDLFLTFIGVSLLVIVLLTPAAPG